MVERSSHVAESPDPGRSGTEWFLDAVFPNGKTVTIRGFAAESEASERPVSFRYAKSTCDGGGLGAHTAATSRRSTARASAATPVPATLVAANAPEPGLTALASKTLTRLSEKWRAATASPWFALLCAGGSFAVLLVFTGVLAGLAVTQQPARIDMTTVPRVETMRSERDYDHDPIAMLIDRTSVPEGPSVAPASSPF